jgi:DNA-binding response OmpR family regulator
LKILVIEDEAKTAQAIRRGLSSEGYEFAVAKTGEEGFLLLNRESFDLGILDWMDLEMDLVTRGVQEVALTSRQFDLLAYLLRHHGQTVTCRMLAPDVWHEPHTPRDGGRLPPGAARGRVASCGRGLGPGPAFVGARVLIVANQ